MIFGRTFTLRSAYEPSVCRLSVTLLHPRQRLELFGNIFLPPNSSWTWTVCFTILGKTTRGSRGSCRLYTRGYEKLAFFDHYLALFRKRYNIRQ